jgi:phosphoenolpyruvate carboxykinase (GTP)
MSVKADEWKAEVPDIEAHFAVFGNRLPQKLKEQLAGLAKRLG